MSRHGAEGGDHAQFRIGQGMEAIHPDRPDAAAPSASMRLGGRSRRRARNARPRPSSSRSTSGKRRGKPAPAGLGKQSGARRALSQPAEANSSMVRAPGSAESRKVGDAREFGAVDAARGLFHDQREHRVGTCGRPAHPSTKA